MTIVMTILLVYSSEVATQFAIYNSIYLRNN